MATINLDKKEGEQNTLGYVITAKTEIFRWFRLFEKVTYKEVSLDSFKLLGFNISISKYKAFIEYDDYNIKENDADYVQYATVYYNKDKNNSPLIIELCKNGHRKYYKFSELLNHGQSIFKITKYLRKKDNLHDDLITENDFTNETLTFRVDKKQNYNNIRIETSFVGGYTKLIHIPKSNDFKGHKSCVMYDKYIFEIKQENQNPLKQNYQNIPKVTDIQGKIFDSINVYYRKKDEDDNIPLLVECIESDTNKIYYYSRKNQYEKRWNIDDSDDDDYDNQQLVSKYDEHKLKERLDSIEFYIKHSVLLLLHKKNNYNKGEMDSNVDYTEKSKDKRDLKDSDKLKMVIVDIQPSHKQYKDYECYKHDLDSYSNYEDRVPNLRFEKLNFRVLKFFIANRCIEIYDQKLGIPLLYQSKFSLYVYFYKDDHFPLLIKYGEDFYGPKTKEEYFTKWEKIENLEEDKNFNLFDQTIIDLLNETNLMLNEIDIQKTSDYGIDDESELDTDKYKIQKPSEKLKSFDFTRIKVNEKNFRVFKKFTHTTKNGFKIGNIFFNKKYFFKNKEVIDEIDVISFSVYYFKYDAITNKDNPLILELELQSKYFKYFILETNGSEFYEYEVKSRKILKLEVNELRNLLDHQNFILNRVISILLEKRSSYTCCDKNKNLDYIDFSNKNNNDFCYIKSVNKIIPVQLEFPRFICVEKLKYYTIFRSKNYTSFKHYIDISQIYDTLPKPITDESVKNLRDFTINKIIINKVPIILKYKGKIKDRLFKTKDAYVHFYNEDPRPLLVYCDNVIFYPKSLETYYTEWEVINHGDFFSRYDQTYSQVLFEYKLNEIYYNLNPVYLHETKDYILDKRFNKPSVNVKSTDFNIFKKFTHTISDDYKLGVAKYRQYFIIGDYKSYEYKFYGLKSVSAYYLNTDSEYKYPLLIEFQFKQNIFKYPNSSEYFELVSINPYMWKKLYIKGSSYTQSKKYENLVRVSKKFIKEPDLIIQTEDSIKFEDEEGQISGKNDYFHNDQQFLNHLTTKNEDYEKTFKAPYVNIDIQSDDQITNTLDLNLLNELKQLRKDTPDIKYITPVIFDEIDLDYYQKMISETRDLESARTDESETTFTQGISRKTINSSDSEITTIPRAEASVGGPNGSSNSSNSNLGPALGGVFGSLFFIGLVAYPAYRFYKKFKIKDMRPIF